MWSKRGDVDTGDVYMSTSVNGGGTWSGGTQVGSFVGDEPTIGVGPVGDIFVTGVTGSSKSAMVVSTNGGQTWDAPEELIGPDGNIKVPQLEGSNGVVALAGVSTSGTVWLRRIQ